MSLCKTALFAFQSQKLHVYQPVELNYIESISRQIFVIIKKIKNSNKISYIKKNAIKDGATQIDPNLALCLNIFQFLKDLTLPLPFFKILQRRHFLCIVTLNLSLSSICLSLFQDLPISITSAIHAIHAMHAIHGSRFQ